MITYNQETPILMVVSGYIENIRQIYNELKQIEPKRLYIVYGTLINNESKHGKNLIKSIISEIPWECKVKTLHNKTQLEYNATMQKAVRWFFRHETEGIVLDGFGLPFPAFFAFCSYLLEKYRYDERIGHISGRDFRENDQKVKTKDSYYFSKLANISSSWASWRRIWQDMDVQQKKFSTFKKMKIIEEIPSHKPFLTQWHHFDIFNSYWETRSEYSNLINNRLSIVPDINQIPVNEYKFPEMNHPIFMVNPLSQELKYQEQKYGVSADTSNESSGFIFLRDRLLSFNKESCRRMKIPRIIHQIYEDPEGPAPNLLELGSTWKEKHPNWEYRFWSRQMINDFLETTCSDFLDYYHSYPFNVQRWDAIRYLILYHIGGLYVDFDYNCLEPLDVLLNGQTCCMGMEPTVNARFYHKPLIVGNALMASIPKHPYMAAIIEDMKSKFSKNYEMGNSIQVMETTGPFMVTRVYEQLKKKKDITLLPDSLVAPLSKKEIWMLQAGYVTEEIEEKVEKAFAIHYFLGSWTPQTT